MTLAERTASLLQTLGVPADRDKGGGRPVRSPLTGEIIAHVADAEAAHVADAVAQAEKAFAVWRAIPPPRRGEFVRLLGEELRRIKPALGELVTIEAGKILTEVLPGGPTGIEVAVRNGVVKLTGQPELVSDEDLMPVVVGLAWDVDGVVDVVNKVGMAQARRSA